VIWVRRRENPLVESALRLARKGRIDPMHAQTVLIFVGFLSFVLAAAEAPIPRVNLVAVGLAFVTLAQLLG